MNHQVLIHFTFNNFTSYLSKVSIHGNCLSSRHLLVSIVFRMTLGSDSWQLQVRLFALNSPAPKEVGLERPIEELSVNWTPRPPHATTLDSRHTQLDRRSLQSLRQSLSLSLSWGRQSTKSLIIGVGPSPGSPSLLLFYRNFGVPSELKCRIWLGKLTWLDLLRKLSSVTATISVCERDGSQGRSETWHRCHSNTDDYKYGMGNLLVIR